MDTNRALSNTKIIGEDICLVDSGTTHTILRDNKYFKQLTKVQANVNTISGSANLIEGSGRANIVLTNGTNLSIDNALYSTRSRRNLLSFKDIRRNGYHIETISEGKKEYLRIASYVTGQKLVLETLSAFSSGLYYTTIRTIQSYAVMHQKCTNPKLFMLWHDRLGHPGSIMMRRIVENSHGHPLKNQKILLPSNYPCTACSQGKLITRPSLSKVIVESPSFLQRIQGDICGPIHPPSGPFRYFMILIDASTRWSHTCLLSTRNIAFAKLLAQIIRLRAQFSDYPIKTIRLDNAGEFTSQTFNDYCMSIGIDVEHPVAHTHTQNGLAESFIKRLQLIARPLLMKTKLPVSTWGHAILHAASLIRVRPTAYHKYSPTQLVLGQQPNISHLRVFGCAVYVPITPPQRTKMGPQRRLGIYVGFDSPSIIRYLEPLTGDVFKARFEDCHFDESVFPPLGGDKLQPEAQREIIWNASTLSHLDPRTNQCELEVQRIIHLQSIANRLPDAFTDTKRVTKSHIPAANIPARIEVPVGQTTCTTADESKTRQKRGRPVGAKDKFPRKRKIQDKETDAPEVAGTLEETKLTNARASEEAKPTGQANERMNLPIFSRKFESPEEKSPEEEQVPTNNEITIHYMNTREILDRNKTVVDNVFSFKVALTITRSNENITGSNEESEPQTVEECRHRNDWPMWKGAIQAELNSLAKREVFGPVVETPEGIQPVGYKWVFVRKCNEKNEVVRYKARLVAQGFSQRPGIDYEETYSPVMDGITFRFLISLVVTECLDMRLMDVVTAYLYGSLDADIYMKIPEGYAMPEACNSKPRSVYSLKLQKSLYGLKQSGRMWYKRLSDYLLKEGYENDLICPCIFTKKSNSGFAIIAVYVDDLNLVGTPEELIKTAEYLKREFEMKDLGKTKFCLGLQIEHLPNGILVHQSAYTEKVLKQFYMDKAHPLSTPMVVRSLDVNKDPFRPLEEGEDILGPEVPYMSAIGALMYLANCTRPDIAFSVNLLARYSSAPTQRHWKGIKHIFRYLRGTIDLGLFYSNGSASQLIGYADAGYLSDPHKARSQTGYVFTCGGAAISWRSVKQTLTATSSNHSEIIAIHETSRECVWLRSMIQHIREKCGLSSIKDCPTILYEDNAACITQIKGGYIKGDRTKHISPKFFYTHDLQKNGDIDVQQIRSSDNLADLFTKALPTTTFKKLVANIGMRRLKNLSSSVEGESTT
ncbi:hypothetical protein RHSIM_Rhsim07G0041900 [Rhododendron simsii]|uniref:Gag-Pol-p199 n=1 Tax=Rhododendron simsii TaxID=118357 RepID=A0A834GPJ6_RHOSS|nr:hypothetical protein RHSIM_Rhsim07G0041900 [Rhododendron simsii]